jgi:hydroxyacylglutathione hydrolase
MADLSTRQFGRFLVVTIPSGEPWKENCYLVRHEDSREQVVIDPGGPAETIAEAVEQHGGRLQRILLTHAHHDHVAAVTELRRRHQIPCYLHAHDARLLRHAPIYSVRFGGERMEPVRDVSTFEGEPDFPFGDGQISTIHTPGHTAGGVVYCLPAFTFTGDTLFNQRVGRTDLPGGDAAALSSSISRLLDRLPGDAVLFPGHGRPWVAAEARAWWQGLSDIPPEFQG